ncbi:centromere protein F-like [Centroberyx affinis]|uniref:centromere protein F-like n=1 Tax=Centroberyx affinis TaxID=166261 RepID=UPI003A5BC756
MDKYCSLMVRVHKLEETKDALTTRLEQITASQQPDSQNTPGKANVPSSTDNTSRRRSNRKSASKQQEDVMDDNAENMPPSAPGSSLQGSSPGKRGHGDISNKDSAQEALHNLTKRIRANTALATTPKRNEQEEEEVQAGGAS